LVTDVRAFRALPELERRANCADQSKQQQFSRKETKMSVSGISSTNFQDSQIQMMKSGAQQFRQEFQQLGQNLQSGNLSAAQADFATLQQLQPLENQTQNADPLTQDFTQLSQDLQGGNLSAAQQDLTKIQQDLQAQAQQVHAHHHHSGRHQAANEIGQEFSQLAQALHSGDLSAAQKAYIRLQQDFAQAKGLTGSSAGSASGSSGVSVSA
jgi:hypothetical protein